jgi:type IV pilus assembly protein PilC
MFTNISSEEKVQIVQNLSLLLDSGVPIHPALLTLAHSRLSSRASQMLLRLAKGVESGSKLHVLLKQEPGLDTIFVSLIEAGEASGTLSHHLSVLAEWLEHEHTMRSNVRTALLYPKIILGTTFVVAFGLATFVLPKLLPIFTGMRIELPIATRILLAITTFIQAYWLVLLLTVISAIVSYLLLMRLPKVRYARDSCTLNMPIIGTLERAYQLTLGMRIIATLYESGIPMPQTLRLAAHAATNAVYERAWKEIANAIERGDALDVTLEKYPRLFYGDVIMLVSVGERTGSYVTIFNRIAEYYRQHINTITKRLPSIIEPLLLVVMTLLIGFVAIAIVLPIYEFTQGISR